MKSLVLTLAVLFGALNFAHAASEPAAPAEQEKQAAAEKVAATEEQAPAEESNN